MPNPKESQLRHPPNSKPLRIKSEVLSAFASEWLATQPLSPPPLLAELTAALEAAVSKFFGGRYELAGKTMAALMAENGLEKFMGGTGRQRWPHVRRITAAVVH